MTIKQFRERHSLLIEHYQFIEMHLEGIYASVCDKRFYEGLQDVEKTNLFGLLADIEANEKESNKTVIGTDDKEALRKIFPRRNYWVHNCYTDIVFDGKTDDIKKQADVDSLENDIRDAEVLRQRLYETYMQNRKLS